MTSKSTITVRDFPYPYSAMMAICSDLDETAGHEEYVEISRYLNTAESTRIGRGVNLEVGNTMYFDMAPDEYSFWNATDEQREDLVSLMKSGHIDTFHSFGDLADSRAHAEKALGYLESQACKLRVWIDHAVAPSNLGADIMQGHGDDPESEVYHTDLTLKHGVEYVWRGRVTSVIGQGVRRRIGGIFDSRLGLKSAITTLKEIVKGLLGRLPGSRFRLHGTNRVMEPIVLRDGQATHEFMRTSPHPLGVSVADRGDRIYEVLRDDVVDHLVQRRGTAIVYTHLGKTAHPDSIFPPQTIAAFGRLAERAERQEVLVATTVRVLDYHYLLSNLEWTASESEDLIRIECTSDASSYQGLTFIVPGEKPVELVINGVDMNPRIERLPGGDGERIVDIPWQPLAWPL